MCLTDIALSLQAALNSIAMPHQNLLSLNALLGKPGGDCRTVCKTPMLYRVLLRADTKVREWELKHKVAFDSAVAGASALQAALKRNLLAEVSFWLGRPCASVFNDYEKFFDAIDIAQLLKEAYACKFPLAFASGTDSTTPKQKALRGRWLVRRSYSA